MSLNEIYETADQFCTKFDISDDEEKIILEYVKTGNGRPKMEACADRECDVKALAKICKPAMKVMSKMQRDSEEFSAAFRFWEYLAQHIKFKMPPNCYSKNFDVWAEEIMSYGYDAKEAVFLVAVNFAADSTRYIYSNIYWSDSRDCSSDKIYKELEKAAFSMSFEDITFDKRLHLFLHKLQSVLLYYKSRKLDSIKDIKELLDRIRFVNSIPFTGTDYGSAYQFSVNALCRCYANYVQYIKYKNKDWEKALLAEGESVFTYAEQMKVFCTYIYPNTTDAYNFLISDDEFRAKLFCRKNISEVNGDLVLNCFKDVISKYGDAQIIIDGLCFSPSKKVAAYCSSELDKRSAALAGQFREFIKTQTLSKNNAAIVKALLEKWDDQSSAAPEFASLKEVEEYAEKQKFASPKLLDKFDYSVTVYGRDKQTVVSEKTLKVFLDKYFSMKDVYRNRTCDNMVKHFDKNSFGLFIDSVYAVWEASDFDNKLKAAIIPYCFYASNAKLYNLRKQCVTFCDAGRHMLAANIIRTVALNGGKYALMLVDGIANKFPYPKAKQTAKNAMSEAAEKYKIPVEVLADLIIPDCGFDINCKRKFVNDITLTLLPDGDIRINRGDKVLKSLPSDVDAETKKEFSAIKKDVKTIIKMQTLRLERAMMFGRSWTYKNFKRSYVAHPVMRLLITNLIWGRYTADGELLKIFHTGLDGSSENSDYEEVELSDGDIIALVHPCDLTKEQLDKWIEYLSDNEIKQPFVQICAKVCYPLKIDEKEKYIDLTEYPFNYSHIQRIARKYDMQRTDALDAGMFEGYYLEDKDNGIGVELTMEELFFGADPTDGSDLKVFFYSTDRKGEYDFVHPDTIPTRFVSSMLSSLLSVMPAMQFADNGKKVKNTFKPFDVADFDFGDDEKDVAENQPAAERSEDTAEELPVEKEVVQPQNETANEQAAVAAPQTAGDSDLREYLEYVEGKSSKFWQIEVRGYSHTVTYGRIGTDGREVTKTFASPQSAMQDAKSLVDSKIKKGYTRK